MEWTAKLNFTNMLN